MAVSVEPILVDANVLIGWFNPKDSLHGPADAMQAGFSTDAPLLLCNVIVYEALNIVSMKAGRLRALTMAKTIRSLIQVQAATMAYVDRALESAAWDLFEARTSKNVSFADCALAAVAHQRSLSRIYSFDKDLKQLGRKLGFTVIGA